MQTTMSQKQSLRLPILLLALALLTILSLSWDNWWHVMKKDETTFSPPHVLTYLFVLGGAVLSIGSVVRGLRKVGRFAPVEVPHIKGLSLLATGCLLQAVALIVDGVIHVMQAFDVSLWTPPHLLLAFGGVLAMLGAAELFVSIDREGRAGEIGYLLSLGMAVAFLQSALSEFDIVTWWAWQARWKGFTLYYAALLFPVIALAVIAGTKRLRRPAGTIVTLVPFLIKVALFGAWSLSPIQMYFPLVIVTVGVMFDIFYMTLRHKGSVAVDFAVGGMAIGMVGAITWQHPFIAGLEDVLFVLITCLLIGMFTAWVVDSMIGDDGEEMEFPAEYAEEEEIGHAT